MGCSFRLHSFEQDLEASATLDELKAEMAAAKTSAVQACLGRLPSRQPFPRHLLRERVMISAPTACPCCGVWASPCFQARHAFLMSV